ncbi:hypothetical protein [Streptomyces sulphureus]|uniref:hypothetical protein n=1 Tax=Streptomyces sulphureus TaxID=47758 RepID=UPI00131A34F3|nr:hypothetical protein [Streptomyces sulphureus]
MSAAKTHMVRGLAYPERTPRYPLLGVRFTRRVDGTVEGGPSAVLAFSPRATGSSTSTPAGCGGSPASRAPGEAAPANGITEMRGFLSVRAYMKAAVRYYPASDLVGIFQELVSSRSEALAKLLDVAEAPLAKQPASDSDSSPPSSNGNSRSDSD